MKTFLIKITSIALLSLALIALLACAFIFGANISFKQQWSLYETLRTTASIILAIMAAWVAIIYPERLKIFKKKIHNESSDDTNRFSVFLHPIINSLVILSIVLLIGIIAPILSQIELLKSYNIILRQFSYLTLVILTLWQIYTIVTVFIPIHLIKQDNDTAVQRQEQMDFYKSRNPKKNN